MSMCAKPPRQSGTSGTCRGTLVVRHGASKSVLVLGGFGADPLLGSTGLGGFGGVGLGGFGGHTLGGFGGYGAPVSYAAPATYAAPVAAPVAASVTSPVSGGSISAPVAAPVAAAPVSY